LADTHVAVAVSNHGGAREVAVEDALERGADRFQRRIVEACLVVGGRVPGREQQRVALAQGHLQRLGQAHDHPAARRRAVALNEADVPLRRPGAERELELAHAAPGAPSAQRCGEVACHGRLSNARRAAPPFPAGNCRVAAGSAR
jgi:hypothetical protein